MVVAIVELLTLVSHLGVGFNRRIIIIIIIIIVIIIGIIIVFSIIIMTLVFPWD